jgi:aconitate hydratase
VLTITEMLRKHGVVGKFVEFYGEGVAAVPLANRATIGNMSPEFGSTCAIFPIDDRRWTTCASPAAARSRSPSSRPTPRPGLWHDPAAEPRFSEYLELDLSTVVPSIAGPKRPQDRVELSDGQAAAFARDVPEEPYTSTVRPPRRRSRSRSGRLQPADGQASPRTTAPS